MLEIYNPTADTIQLNNYSIERNDLYRFDFPGGVILPFSTWVGCRNEPANPPDPKVLAVADTSWPAAGSIWFLSNTAKIELVCNGKVIDAINGDPRNAVVAGVTGALEKFTLIRKSTVFRGDSIWDNSRGTNPEDSQWLVNNIFYDDLGKHAISLPGIPWLKVRFGTETLISGVSLVDLGSVPLNQISETDIILENTDNISSHPISIESSDPIFLLSDTDLVLQAGATDTIQISYTPVEVKKSSSVIQIASNDLGDSLFIFRLNAVGTKFSPQDTIRFYVSPSGNDSNSGESMEQPLKSIQAAINMIIALERPAALQLPPIPAPSSNPILGTPDNYRDLILANLSNLEYRVEVHLLPGWHFLDSRIIINQMVGGNLHFIGHWNDGAESEIKTAFENHVDDPLWMDLPVDKLPVVSGGRQIAGWRDTTVNGVSAWVTELPEVASGSWYFKQLYVDGKRVTRSRFPKSGTLRITEILPTSTGIVTKMTDRVRVGINDFKNWKNLTAVEMVHLHRWVDERLLVKSLETSSGIVTLERTPAYDMDGSHPIHGAGLSAYFWDNVFETMSEPGEWYLDKPSGMLFYIPEPGQQKETTEVIAPKLLSMFKIQGVGLTNSYMWDVSFEKIGFMHTESVTSEHIGSGNSNTYGDGAISYEHARVPVVKACYFAHLGNIGVEFQNGTMGGEISSNVFRDLGSGATGVWQLTTNDLTRRTGYHHINDNDIMGYGRFYFGEVAIRQFNTVHMLIEHNYIRDGYFNAITITSTKDTYSCFGYRNIIRKNKIHNLGHGELSDMGAIYTSGYMPYSFIDNNLVYNIEGRDYNGDVIYLDDNTAHFTVRNNILFNSNEDVFEEKSYFNLIENNIIAFGARSALYSHESSLEMVPDIMGLGIKPTEFNRNIVLQNGARSLFRGPDTSPDPVMQHKGDYNLYWDYSIPDAEMNEGQSFEQWKATSGDDANSIFADPGLVDPLNGDFRFVGDSPAKALGFVEIDMTDVGTRKSEWDKDGIAWIDYPPKPTVPDFLPSEIPGLHMWLTAKDLEADKVSRWEDRTSNKFSFYQFIEEWKPSLNKTGLNGFQTVHFADGQFMSTSHKSLEVSGSLALFGKRDFTIFLVHKSSGNQTVYCKGSTGANGTISIGETQNQLQWGNAASIGKPGEDFKLRTYSRSSGQIKYYENQILRDSTSLTEPIDFNNNWIQSYLGKSGESEGESPTGEIAEFIIYRGILTTENRNRIEEYLFTEWGLNKPLGISSLDALIPSVGNLTPAFSSDKLSYKLEIPFNTENLTITATRTDLMSTVEGEGTFSLSKDTTLSIVVTSEDGTSVTTYNVLVEILLSNISSLDGLTVSAGSLVPEFSPDILNYTLSLPQGTESIILTAAKTDPMASVSGDGIINLSGNTNQNIVVTAQDGVSTTTYLIEIDIETSVKEAQTESFRIFPNPVENELTVELDSGETGAYIKIMNMIGEIVSEKYEYSSRINVSTDFLPKGIYFISIKTNKLTETRKIIKL